MNLSDFPDIYNLIVEQKEISNPEPYTAKNSTTAEEIEGMLNFIDPDVGFHEWLNVGMAIHSEGHSIDVWDTWSKCGKKYKNQNDLQKHWKTFKADKVNGVSVGTIKKMAIKGGWSPLNPVHLLGAPSSHNIILPSTNLNRSLSFIRADELQDVKQQCLVEDVIPKHSLTMFFGPSGGGKTFAALSIGLSIASGVDWYGHGTKQGAVIYICGEGKAGIKKRLQAWAAYIGKSLDGLPFYISSGAADFSDPSSVMQVQEAIEALKLQPVFIIVDTLSRNNSADENDTAAMAAFVKALDNLKDQYQASVLIVHHTGHTEKERARGSSVLKAALDAEFRVNKTGSLVTFCCTKMKDSEEPETKQFELRSIPIVTNGALETGAVLTLAKQPAIKLSPQNEQAVEVLKTFNIPVSIDEFKKQLVLEGIIDAKPENIRRILKRIINELSDKGLLSEADGFLKAANKADNARTKTGQGGQLGMNSIPFPDGQDSPPIGAVCCPNGGLNE